MPKTQQKQKKDSKQKKERAPKKEPKPFVPEEVRKGLVNKFGRQFTRLADGLEDLAGRNGQKALTKTQAKEFREYVTELLEDNVKPAVEAIAVKTKKSGGGSIQSTIKRLENQLEKLGERFEKDSPRYKIEKEAIELKLARWRKVAEESGQEED